MAFHVDVSDETQNNADQILDWLISSGAGEAGLRWFRRLEAAIQSLSHFPQRCSLAPENHRFSFEVRQLLYGRKPHIYRILFTIEGETVYVLQIRHGRRQYVEG